MPSFPCPNKSICIDPANPIANLSAEAPDPNLFIGYNSFWAGPPPLDSIWTSTGCISQCVSTVSQLDADICAANQQITCTTQDGGPGGDDNGWIDPGTGKRYSLCFNSDQTCVVKCADGLPFSFTERAGRVLALNCGQANQAAFSIACVQAVAHRVCLSALSQTEACINSSFSATITASGSTVDPIRNIWLNPGGGLPPGINMSFDIGGPTLTLSGTPTQAGTFTFAIEVLTPTGDFMVKNFTICVIDVSPSSLPNVASGTAYSQTLTAPCGESPLNWQVTSGALPPGLSLDQSTGVISGTTTTLGTFSFTVTVQTSAT
jgi:hypothetical protein